MSKSSRTNVRKKVTKNIEKQRTIEIMKANINPVTNNPNYSKINNLTGVDRKTLARWWKNREKIASSKNKHSRQNLESDKILTTDEEEEDEDDEETDKKVSQKVRSLLISLDLAPKTLKSKRKKLNRALQQSMIMRMSRNSRNRFTFDGANNVDSNGNL